METKKRYRDVMAEYFIKGLTEEPLDFIRGWNFSETGIPENANTEKAYKGINRLYLKMLENKLGYGDNRWLTFKQIKDKGYHLQKGAKGAKVEYFFPYDNKEKRWAAWEEYTPEAKINDGKDITDRYVIKQKIYTVFNASLIDGIPEKKIDYARNMINEDEVIKKISQGIGVEIIESKNSTSAFYTPSEDYIKIPAKEQFKSQGDYVSTTLHELAHATGHKDRLNRSQEGQFGSKEYAFEELIAEITSSFMGEYIKEPISDEMLDKHKAYIQSWTKGIKDDKNFLFKAIKEAEIASDYMIEKAHLREYKNDIELITTFISEKKKQINTFSKIIESSSTPVYMIEADKADKIRDYAAEKGISRLDPLQQNAVNGTVKDLKDLYEEAKKKEQEFSFSKDEELEF